MGEGGHACYGQSFADRFVPGLGEGREIGCPVDRSCACLFGHLREEVLGPSTSEDQIGAEFSQVPPQLLQAAEHEAGAGGRREAPPGDQAVVEDEAGDDPFAGGRFGEGGQVVQSEVTAKPHDRGAGRGFLLICHSGQNTR